MPQRAGSLEQNARRGIFGLRRRSGGEPQRHTSVDPPSRSGGNLVVMTCKIRLSELACTCFDRVSGLNVLLDEVDVPAKQVSQAPRYLSVALTNACELRCAYGYAPKNAAALDVNRVVAWAVELDGAGCLGIGFGGGEPTAHPRFAQLCTQIAESTSMAVTFTTHGHRLNPLDSPMLCEGLCISRACPSMVSGPPTSGFGAGRLRPSVPRLRGFVRWL